jgi:MFS family permease
VWPPLLCRGGTDDLLFGTSSAVSGLGWHLPGRFRIYLLFCPERAPTASAIAVAFATILLPFTVPGPFVGVPLDRWPRRRILVASNDSRAVPLLLIAQLVVRGDVGWLFYLLVQTAFCVNRLLLAGLSASMPHVAGSELLVTANAVSPTSGTLAHL